MHHITSAVFAALTVTLVGSTAHAAEPVAPGVTEPGSKPASGIGLAVGDKPADAIVLDIDGSEVALSSLYAEGPLVVTFYRGGWCPYCTTALTEWQGKLEELEAAGGRLIALTPDKPGNAGDTMAKNDLGFEIYSDASFAAADAFKLRFALAPETKTRYEGYGIDLATSNASGTWELPHPGTYVLDSTGVIRYAWVQEDFRVRASPDDVIAAVRGIE